MEKGNFSIKKKIEKEFHFLIIANANGWSTATLILWIGKKKLFGASWELNPGPLACFVFLFIQEVAQSENHTTRPHARTNWCLPFRMDVYIYKLVRLLLAPFRM